MAEKKSKYRYTPADRLMRLHRAGLKKSLPLRPLIPKSEAETTAQEKRENRLQAFISLMKEQQTFKAGFSMAFVVYDIEDNRVRRYIAKYLESKGYIRVQKSVFFGHLKSPVHQEVANRLKQVNAAYENGDSIMLVPISRDLFNQLKIVGKNIGFDMSLGFKNTVFF
jgi:CRISPR-associated protein Cas2